MGWRRYKSTSLKYHGISVTVYIILFNFKGNSNTTGSNSSGGNSANPFASLGSGLGGLGGGGLGAMNPEMMRGTMDMLRQNPELMRSMLNTMNPQLANNPRMQEVYHKYNFTNSYYILDVDKRPT